ncbi:hypothetical protein S245_001315, partial [Arachis hypogaea]
PLHDRLKKNPPPLTDKHSEIIRFLKTKVRNLPYLYLLVPHALKIVETDASDLGCSGILKQKLHDKECIIAFTSKHWNSTQQIYSTIKKKILAIVLCITKFQSDLLNQNFLVRVDCKSAKEVLQKDVKNLASKQIFASTSRATQTLSLTFSHVNICRELNKIKMPKKAIIASSRGRGKGIRLALTGPSRQSQSDHEYGSSTQKPNKKLTQQSIEPATNQAKQTKTDYAFPIQTLMALQDQGVTKLNKKSWADICSESDEEIDLTQLISQVANQKIIAHKPKEKAIALTPQTSSITTNTQKTQTNYIPTKKISNIIQMEPEFWDESPNKVIPKIFPTGFHFKPISPNKSRQCYEFILVVTDSVSIKHYKDKTNPELITHSTIQILRVMTLKQFGKNLSKNQKFSQNYNPI